MRRYFGCLAAGALAACSSSSNNAATNAPPLTTFTYSTPTPVQEGSQQAATASDAASSVSSVVASAGQGDVRDTSSAPELADTIGAEALGAAAIALPRNPSAIAHNPGAQANAIRKLVAATKSGQLASDNCYTESGNTLTYANCQYSDSGISYTLNGTLTATLSEVTWNINFTLNYSDSNGSISYQGQWQGDITYTATTINGSCISEDSGTFQSSGQPTEEFAYTVGLNFLDLTTDSSCDDGIVSGTLEVRANVSGSESGISGYEKEGIEFTWTGCDVVTIATSTD